MDDQMGLYKAKQQTDKKRADKQTISEPIINQQITQPKENHMTKHEIYLAGGCFWGVEKYISNIKGVLSTTVGYANGDTGHPTYEQVRYENSGHAETVKVVFDEDALSLEVLLKLFFRIIDPTAVDQQGEDIGHQYRTGIYHTDPADEAVIAKELEKLAAKVVQNEDKPLAIEACPLVHFYDAEEYHQDYLDKNPAGYCHVPLAEIMWVKTIDPMKLKPEEMN